MHLTTFLVIFAFTFLTLYLNKESNVGIRPNFSMVSFQRLNVLRLQEPKYKISAISPCVCRSVNKIPSTAVRARDLKLKHRSKVNRRCIFVSLKSGSRAVFETFCLLCLNGYLYKQTNKKSQNMFSLEPKNNVGLLRHLF